MKATELIEYLQEYVNDFGDLDLKVSVENYNETQPLETILGCVDEGYLLLQGWDDLGEVIN